MPRRGENIRKRKDGRWEGRYICDRDTDGKAKYRSVYAKTYSEVRKTLCDVKGGKNSPNRQKTIVKTFGSVAYLWLSGCKLRLKQSTMVKYTALLENHILPRFKDTNISLISDDIIAEFIREKSIKLSSSMIRSLLTTIRSVLSYARRQGWYNYPLDEFIIPSKKKREVSSLSNLERHQLEEFLITDMDTTKLGLYLCLYTGLRIGELCALRWEDIDLRSMVLHIRSTIQRIKCIDPTESQKTVLLITTPKSISSIRDIPLPVQIVELLKGYEQSENCFLLSGKTSPVEPRTMQYRFKRYAEQLGLAYSNPHVLRHTFATQCIELGFDAKTLSELLGHSRVEITLNRYVHSSDEHKRSQMNLLFMTGQDCGL